jgi:hypothetical protein
LSKANPDRFVDFREEFLSSEIRCGLTMSEKRRITRKNRLH